MERGGNESFDGLYSDPHPRSANKRIQLPESTGANSDRNIWIFRGLTGHNISCVFELAH